jgi:uncharacterized membrane protein
LIWFLFASITACCEALKDLTSKQSLKSLDLYVVLWAFMAVGAIALFPAMLLTTGWPSFGPRYGEAVLLGGSLNVLAFWLYTRAIQTSDLSLTVPLVTLTPLFMLVTSPLIVQEYPTWGDAVGVLLLIGGSYVLNSKAQGIDGARESIWAPFRAIATNPGSRMMLVVAFLWSITSNVDKVGVQNSSPLAWAITLFTVISAAMFPLAMRRGWVGLVAAWSQARLLGLTGLFNATGVGFQMAALTLVPVTQVIAVKRMSALIAVLLGVFVLGEEGLRSRLLGAGIMVVGVALISLM